MNRRLVTLFYLLPLAGSLWIAAAPEAPAPGIPPTPEDVTSPPQEAQEGNETGDETSREPVEAADPERGRLSYRIHCQSCHGPEGRGDGPMAEDLKVPVPDLTLLAAHADGKLPHARLRMVIDGRLMVRGHGSSEMPIWGLVFGDPGKTWSEEPEIRARICDLLAFLGTLQREVEDGDSPPGHE